MSEVKPLNFRRMEDGAAGSGLAKPNWLAPRDVVIRPAFVEEPPRGPIILPAPSEPAHEPEPELDQEPSPYPGMSHQAQHAYAQPAYPPAAPFSPEPPRRSSLPPRKSVYPPQVTISRYPAPPIEAEVVPSPEQEAFATAALELASLRARVLSTVESDLLALAVHIAQAIIEREVKVDPSIHTTLARTAVLALGDTQAARLRVSRTAYRAITELHGGPAIDVDGVRVEVSMDASFEGLSVVAEAGPSRVDARVAERLAAVLRAMEAEHRRNNAEIAAIDEQET